ncbi:hypothetical protein MNBD_GAMMA09-1701 [hydrothermal vent metagenome]|uniref:Uncharacterized protein n=1 Tax=hydrothermal vent metagenome TaxID=652676 RepID=A0A3B0YM20_9ZZZZ
MSKTRFIEKCLFCVRSVKNIFGYVFFWLCFSPVIYAGKAQVEQVVADCNEERICNFDVSIRHADEGWTHFANGWEILTPQGELLGRRVLAHPHVKEQPFTRSLRNIKIPAAVDSVVILAYDSVHGKSDRKYVLKLKFKPKYL